MHRGRKKSASLYFEEVEEQIKTKEAFVSQQIDILKKMHDDLNRLIEYKAVLSKAASVIGGARASADTSMSEEGSNDSKSIHQSLVEANEISIAHI